MQPWPQVIVNHSEKLNQSNCKRQPETNRVASGHLKWRRNRWEHISLAIHSFRHTHVVRRQMWRRWARKCPVIVYVYKRKMIEADRSKLFMIRNSRFEKSTPRML